VAVDATAFPHREASFNILILGQWNDAAEDPLQISWVRNCWEAVNLWASGAVYLNALSGDEAPEVVRDAYGANYARLAALKAQLDPKNLFCLNQNIAPST
jgi:FAD/FMN-containing dehydrogenase